MIKSKHLGVGFVGGGEAARAHLHNWAAVRNAAVLGAWAPETTDDAAKPYRSIAAMVADPAIDALWLCGTSDTRLEYMEEIADAVIRAKGKLIGVASATPLGPDVAAAQRVTALAAHAGLKHGYLEAEVFAPQVVRERDALWKAGRPQTARATVTHAGSPSDTPLRALSSGVLVTRYLLTRPGEFLPSLRPQRVTGTVTARSAAITIEFATVEGTRVSGEAHASWDEGPASTDADGYRTLHQHFVDAFLGIVEPLLTFEDGLDVIRIVAAAKRSATQGKAVDYAL